jgi:hypothetical protein
VIRALWLCLLLAALAGGCSERPRVNPLDPENSETGGFLVSFDALAGDAQVELRWVRLTQTGVLGYSIQRWRPGGSPENLGDEFTPNYAGAVDSSVGNDTTYVYRLVAHFVSGDSAVSPPDSATPGTRKIVVLSAGLPGLVRLTADARDILADQAAPEPYGAISFDRVHTAIWLTLPDAGLVVRRGFEGFPLGVSLDITAPADVSVSSLRGIGWVASPSLEVARAYGPSLDSATPYRTISAVGRIHVIRAGSLNPNLWMGNDEGVVRRFTSESNLLLGTWTLGAPIVAMALDETSGRTWVASGIDGIDDLYVIDTADSTATRVQSGLRNVVDLAFSTTSRSLWISQRGTPGAGSGLLTRASDTGAVLTTVSGLEPFGLAIDPAGESCWVSDLRSKQLLQIAPDGAVLLRSHVMDTPYAEVVFDPAASP